MTIVPFSIKDTPSLIEKAWPTSKISAETQKERKAGSGQTLTGLGSYWKGRKPLILTRACVLASLMPATGNLARDVEIFEKVMGFDEQGMSRRLPKAKRHLLTAPYDQQVAAAKRPEEMAEAELLEGVWDEVNAHLGTSAGSVVELVEQLGIMRFGRRPKLADTFSGSGSIPFEAARIGCDVYASDLNPVACMLTWGAFNIVGASPERHAEMKAEQERIVTEIDREICDLGIEHDADGNRGKVYLYCIETRCPITGWMVPIAPSWVISKKRNVVAKLVPDHENMRYDIEIEMGVSADEMAEAAKGTVRKGRLVHPVLDDPIGASIKEIRGDHKGPNGDNRNKLRLWEKHDFRPRPDDIFQERLYAIQWMSGEDLRAGKANPRTWFAAPTAADLDREEEIAAIVEANLADWQEKGFVPDMRIEPGYNTSQPIRERGWTHWHHLFNARQILLSSLWAEKGRENPFSIMKLMKALDFNSRMCIWQINSEACANVFTNQALNSMFNYPCRASLYFENVSFSDKFSKERYNYKIFQKRACEVIEENDIYITDPPYADAVQYDEITEFFIAWIRKNPPNPFNGWTWDSRRSLAIKGSGQDFKVSMIEAYKAMTDNLSDNGLQIVQFTHQDAKTWSDMAQIFWGSGLQVVQDWYVSTETDSGLKVGGYVQGTHNIILRKRASDESGYSDEIVHEIREEVIRQLEEMRGLNQTTGQTRMGNIFNDADLQMAGYAAALRVLTSYARIDGMDMAREALRPRKKGEKTTVDELVEFAVRVANEYSVPEGVPQPLWLTLSPEERFYLRMTDAEAAGPVRLDDFQNFAKAFKVTDFGSLMASNRPNDARLRGAVEFGRKSLGDEPGFGKTTAVRQVLYAVNRIHAGDDAEKVLGTLQAFYEEPGSYRRRSADLAILADHFGERWRGNRPEEASHARVLANLIRSEVLR